MSRRPALFQLRHHFVPEERIGIEETGAQQVLIKRTSSAQHDAITAHRETSYRETSSREMSHRKTPHQQTSVAPAAQTAWLCACAGADHTRTLLRSRRETSTHPSRSLPRLTPYGVDVERTVRGLTLSRSDTRGRIAANRRSLFCIRLHFVLEERIGVGKIGAKRFLTIDESARRDVFGGRTRRRHNLRRQEF